MFSTAKEYFSENNLMDLRIQSSIGLTDSDISALKAISGVQYATGQKFTDALVRVNGEIEADIDGTQLSTRAYGISPSNISAFLNGMNDGNYINRPELISGKYPSAVNECLVDDSKLSTPDSYKIGSKITLSDGDGTTPDGLNTSEFTVVGIVRCPYYLSFERGNTTIGSGKVGTYIFVPDEAFTADYYSEIYVTIEGSDQYEPYSDEYFEFIKPYADSIRAIAARQASLRISSLKPDLEKKISDAQLIIDNSSDEVNAAVAEIDETIAKLQQLIDNGAAQIQAAEAEIATKYAGAQNVITNNTAEYQQAIATYTAQKAEFDRQQQEYNEKNATFLKGKEAYDTVVSQCQSASAAIENAQSTIDATNSLIAAGEAVLVQIQDSQTDAYNNEQIQAVIQMMQVTYPELYNSVKALTVSGLAGEVAVSLAPYIETQKATLAQQQKTLDTKKAELDALNSALAEKETELKTATLELANAKAALESANTQLAAISSKLTGAGFDIQSGTLQIQIEKVAAENKLSELKAQVVKAPEDLAKAQMKREEIINSLDSGLADAERQIKDAKQLYDRLDSVTWNVYDRNDTPGYSGYGQSVKNIEVLSNIFPIFFFIISSMICLTTMKRMVEEDRTVLGTYKALGYKSGSVVLKYAIYSLSACIFGTILGIVTAVLVFPPAINYAYSIMYSLPDLKFIFPVRYSLIGFGISFICTAVTTIFVTCKTLKLKPAVLMRPKTPDGGKRIFLEHIRFLWRHIGFTSKVTLRNMFRNKQRFFMTLFGIAGCTALLLASLGMYNSISAITTSQYGENAISKYDFQIVFNDPQTEGKITTEFIQAQNDVRIESTMLTAMKSMTGSSERSSKKSDVYVFVPYDPSMLPEYVDLRDRVTGKKYVLDQNGAVITEKVAKETKTEVGENITFTDSEGRSYSVPVTAIAENYTFNYIYMTPEVYKQVTGSAPQYGFAIGRISTAFKDDPSQNLSNIKGQLATDLMKMNSISAVAYTSDTTKNIGEITDALSLVILIFFVSALILAFVVLYNLSNINIIERTRELATLKVLGFVDKEVSRYIYRENIAVSVFGILFGLAFGIGLHYLLITFTAIDAVMYGQTIPWFSFVIAAAITVMIIITVNVILHHKLKKIDMVLSLKSVE